MADRVEIGDRVKDSITGMEGIAVARCEWLYGCVRVSVQAEALYEGKAVEYVTFDEPQLVVVKRQAAGTPKEKRATTGGARPDVMSRPNPGRNG
jgi:hypothetical protein